MIALVLVCALVTVTNGLEERALQTENIQKAELKVIFGAMSKRKEVTIFSLDLAGNKRTIVYADNKGALGGMPRVTRKSDGSTCLYSGLFYTNKQDTTPKAVKLEHSCRIFEEPNKIASYHSTDYKVIVEAGVKNIVYKVTDYTKSAVHYKNKDCVLDMDFPTKMKLTLDKANLTAFSKDKDVAKESNMASLDQKGAHITLFYADNNEVFNGNDHVTTNSDGTCSYKGYYYKERTKTHPIAVKLIHTCDIKDNPGQLSSYKPGDYKVYADDGSYEIIYKVQNMRTKVPRWVMKCLLGVTLLPVHTYKYQDAQLQSFRPQSSGSSDNAAFSLSVHENMSTRRLAVFYAQNKGVTPPNKNVYQNADGTCTYKGFVYVNTRDHAPTKAKLIHDCTIKNSPLLTASYATGKYKVMIDNGNTAIIYNIATSDDVTDTPRNLMVTLLRIGVFPPTTTI